MKIPAGVCTVVGNGFTYLNVIKTQGFKTLDARGAHVLILAEMKDMVDWLSGSLCFIVFESKL
jgi:hypothetical protein